MISQHMIEQSRKAALEVENVKHLPKIHVQAWYLKKMRFLNLEHKDSLI